MQFQSGCQTVTLPPHVTPQAGLLGEDGVLAVLDLPRWEPGPSVGQQEETHDQPDLHCKASRTPPGENIISDLQVSESQHETRGPDDHGVMTIMGS